jgi:dTDP-4-amino-4,6-dideoxygalactose transaminase
MDKIPFNKPYFTGFETRYIEQAVKHGKISGNGYFTQKCQEFFEVKYSFTKCLLTTSCTDALEMAAILLDIKEGDEVIAPSFTFVSTVNAFVLRGAKIVFVDSRHDHPGLDEDKIEELITPKTKVIIPVHYAGVACDMDKIMTISEKYNLFVVEDAAQGIDSYYLDKKGDKKPLGSFGHFAAFSFHETKNIISGEGGMLVINDSSYIERAEIIWEKGTNRSKFFRGEIDKYGWVDIGSSFLPSDVIGAFLWAQLENLEKIQNQRLIIWSNYYKKLEKWASLNNVKLPFIPEYSTNNAHMFYLIFNNLEQRNFMIEALRVKNINAVFHYQSLHKSDFYLSMNSDKFQVDLPNCAFFSDTLLRLPFYFELNSNQVISEILALELK